jgi:3-deoxy-7-phosphoheptulonate synthase
MTKKKVGYQGIPGAYSEKAALNHFKETPSLSPFRDFETVFTSVVSGRIDYGVIPLENSLAGSILENFDHLQTYNVQIIAELKLRVKHQLLGLKNAKLGDIKVVRSHPQALAQCKKNLKSLGRFEVEPYYDTAGAVADMVNNDDPTVASIASDVASKHYPVKTLKSGIEDNNENYTRFVIVQKGSKRRPNLKSKKKIKTSIVYSLKNIPGALFKSLSAFSTRDIDLLKIESRPIPGSPFKYQFFIDFDADVKSEAGANAMRHLQEISESVKILGSYNY